MSCLGKSAAATRGSADGTAIAVRHHRHVIPNACIPLVSCRDCASRLLQPRDVVGPVEGTSIVTRFCPECGRWDVVVAEDVAVQVWLRRDAHVAARMSACADVLACELMSAARATGQ